MTPAPEAACCLVAAGMFIGGVLVVWGLMLEAGIRKTYQDKRKNDEIYPDK